MTFTRRDLARMTLAALPLAKAWADPDSRIGGVQIGVISYSFRAVTWDVDEIIKAMVRIGLNEIELMVEAVEASLGAPSLFPLSLFSGGGQAQGNKRSEMPTAAQMAAFRAWMSGPEARKAREDLRRWRLAAAMDGFRAIRGKFDAAGIDLALLCFNFMSPNVADDEIEYAFQLAEALGVKAITTSTLVSVSKRVAPFADKHKLMVGYHGHDDVNDPDQFATIESFETAMSWSRYHGVNLDLGHFTAANFDAVAFIRQHHDRITNIHLKDRKKNHGPNVPWGQGDTPIVQVLQLMRREKYPFPANIEYEYQGESDPVSEVSKCLAYCRQALA